VTRLFEVAGDSLQPVGPFDPFQGAVASKADQSSDSSGCVVMVDVKRPLRGFGCRQVAKSTEAPLLVVDSVVLGRFDAVAPLTLVGSPVRDIGTLPRTKPSLDQIRIGLSISSLPLSVNYGTPPIAAGPEILASIPTHQDAVASAGWARASLASWDSGSHGRHLR
jgi:hypothetical protein